MLDIPDDIALVPDVNTLDRATIIADLEVPTVRLPIHDADGRERQLLIGATTSHIAIIDPGNEYEEILALGRSATAGEAITAYSCFITGYRRGFAQGRLAAQLKIREALGIRAT